MIPGSIKDTSEIANQADKILMCLVSSRDPAQAIFRKYEEAQDKDVFVAALIGNLILRHRQWQVQSGKQQPPGNAPAMPDKCGGNATAMPAVCKTLRMWRRK